jgi:hypothetical protein
MWTAPSVAELRVAGFAPLAAGVPIAATVVVEAGSVAGVDAGAVGFVSVGGAPPDSALRSSSSILRTCCRISSISFSFVSITWDSDSVLLETYFTRSSSSWAVEVFVGMAVVDVIGVLV